MSARQESNWWMRTAESDLRGARALASGDPTEYYDSGIAQEAVELAEAVLRFCREEIPS